ncbi:hypothetical protein MPSEU_000263300 [Mayamaea pseudoterrestris]|nr:hypothetical protein MPSEU_000263300 [Mayamaea pseudoterrestris]
MLMMRRKCSHVRQYQLLLLCIFLGAPSSCLVLGFAPRQLAARRFQREGRIRSYDLLRVPPLRERPSPRPVAATRRAAASSLSASSSQENSAINISLTVIHDANNLHAINATEQSISESSLSAIDGQLPPSCTTPANANAAAAAASAPIPSYRQLLTFLFTTVLIWLSEPVLSLVDATVIGSLKTKNAIIQLAAIGPATTLYDSLLYMTYFLAIATTNKLTKANATQRKNYRQLQTITSHVLGVAAVLGCLVTVFCYAWGPRVLKHMVVGNAATTAASVATATSLQTQALLHHAGRYTAIRASVSVASIMGMVMQAILLATLDTKTPILAVLAASIVNVFGDLMLRPWGVQGAAIATAAASVLSAGVLYGAVRRRMNEWRRLEEEANDDEEEDERMTQSLNEDSAALETSLKVNDSSVDATHLEPGLLASAATNSKQQPVPIMSIPDRKSFIELVKLSGPIFFVILAKIACYGAMTLRATDFGVVPLAAHNIMMRIYFFYGTFGDSISQTAQTYLPATLYPKLDSKSFNKILRRLITIAAIVSIVNSQACMLILRHCGRFLVRDAGIVGMMSQNAGFVGLALMLHPFIMFLEGVVIASRDFRTLTMTYVATLGLHFSVLNFFCQSFPAIWRTFFVFQAIRAGSFSWNVWRRQRALSKRDEASSNVAAAVTK